MSNEYVRRILPDEEEFFNRLLEKKHLLKLRCGIYARKSQMDIKDTSLETQINYCRSMIDGCELLEYTNTYQEDNVSGMWDDREEFQRMINDIKENVIDVVVCYKWDRFGRKSSDVQTYWELILKHNGYILAGDSFFVVDTPTKLFSQQLQWNDAEREARSAAERVILTMINVSKNQHRYISGTPPYGYVRNNIGGLDLDCQEALTVSEIFKSIIAGKSLGTISNDLQSNGITTKNGNKFSKQAIVNIARNVIYKGTLLYNRRDGKKKKKRLLLQDYEEVLVDNVFPPIVSEEDFELVQTILNKKVSMNNIDTGHIYLLSGLIRCNNCNRHMVGVSSRGR